MSQEAGFVLSIVQDGCKQQTDGSSQGGAAAAVAYVTLSETINLISGGKYECQLHFREELMKKNVFHHKPGNNLHPYLI